MRRLLCWLLGHDRMTNGGAHRRCLRCGMHEKRRNLGHVQGWEEVTPPGGEGERPRAEPRDEAGVSHPV